MLCPSNAGRKCARFVTAKSSIIGWRWQNGILTEGADMARHRNQRGSCQATGLTYEGKRPDGKRPLWRRCLLGLLASLLLAASAAAEVPAPRSGDFKFECADIEASLPKQFQLPAATF